MRAILALFVFLLCGSVPLLAQPAREPAVAPVPDWVEPVTIPSANPALTDRPAQSLLVSSQSLYLGDHHDHYTELAILIQNAQGLQALGNIALPWQPDQGDLIVHTLQIIRNGTIIDLLAHQHFTVLRRENNLESATLDGMLTATIQPEGLAVGDVLHIAFTMRRRAGTLPLRGEIVFPLLYGAPIRHGYIRQIWPTGHPMQWRATGVMQQARTRSTRLGAELVVDLHDVEGPQPPTLAPPRLALPTMLQVSEYRDWAAVSAALASHYHGAEMLGADSPLRAEIARIAALSPDPRLRAMSALRLVQDQVRYFALVMGDGNYLPATADATWSRRFADCKGKAVLLLALLHGLGIDAEAILVNSALGDGLNEHLPMLSAFNHVIVRARIGGRSYWLDGTRTGDRNLDDLASSTLGYGLPLRASGATLEPLPYAPPTQALWETVTTYDGAQGLQSAIPFRQERIARGDFAATMHATLSQMGRDAFLTQVRQDLSSMPGTNPSIETAEVNDNVEVGTFSVTVSGRTRLNWAHAPGTAAQRFRFDNGTISWDVDLERPAGPFRDAPFAFPVPAYLASTEVVILPHNGDGFSLDGQSFDRVVAGTRISRALSLANGRATARSEFRRMEREVSAAVARGSTAQIGLIRDDPAFVRAAAGIGVSTTPAVRAAALPRGATDLASRAAALATGGDTHSGKTAEAEPTTAQDYVARGFRQLQANQLDAADADFVHAAALSPNWSRPLSNRAIILIRRERYDEAEPLVIRAGELDANDFVVHQARGLIEMAHNRPVQAVVAFSRSLELEPDNSFTLLQRASAYERVGEFDSALADLASVLAREPRRGDVLIRQARIHTWRGESDQAIAAVDALVAADPQDPGALLVRARALGDLGRPEAAAAFTAALARVDALAAGSPAQSEALGEARREILAESGQSARAVAEMAPLLTRRPDDPALLNSRCWIRATGNIELTEALVDCDRAVAHAPGNAAILDSRAFVRFRLGQIDGALADEEAALARNPQLPAALYVRGLAHLRKGERSAGERDLAAARRLVFDIDARYRRYGVTP